MLLYNTENLVSPAYTFFIETEPKEYNDMNNYDGLKEGQEVLLWRFNLNIQYTPSGKDDHAFFPTLCS